MIASIIFIFVFMLIITAKNINNTFSWIFAAMFASLNIIFLSMIFYIIKLSNYYSIFDIENNIFMLLTRFNVNFFQVRTFVNLGVVLFMVTKFCLCGICGVKPNTKQYVIFIVFCFAFELLYMFFNSFTFIQKLFLLRNSNIATEVEFGKKITYIVRFYNTALLTVSFILPYITIIRSYKSTPLAFKKKQFGILLVILAIVDIFFVSTFIFGLFKGKIINNITLELLTVYEAEHVNKMFVYFPFIILIMINIIYMLLVKYRILDGVSFFRNRVILKNIKVLPSDIRNVTHSYKNSIFAITALCDEIREYYSEDNRLNSIVDQIDTISGTILGQLATFANLTNSDVKKISEIDIQSCIDDAISKLSCKGITIEKNYDDSPKYILAERSQIVEALYNILVNSVEAIHISGKKEGTIRISVYTDIDWVCISVWDNGCGIKRKDIKKLYNPLYSTKKTNKNWGIGLSYAYKVIKAYLGIIFCESVYGEYTEFQILLPCKYVKNQTIW